MQGRVKDLHALPRVRDSWSYLYVEHCQIEQDERAIAVHTSDGVVPVPCAALMLLMLGPGTTVTHAAIKALAENGCLVAWTGEEGVRFYAEGMGETRSAATAERQARLWADAPRKLVVAHAMYAQRFAGNVDTRLTLEQLRGKEGVRVREAYLRASRESGIAWRGRNTGTAGSADAVNQALSWANACLYGLCHAAIVSAGYLPPLGFLHSGHRRSFVFDVADFYKADISIPVAFSQAHGDSKDLQPRVRRACRDLFRTERLLERILTDINAVLTAGEQNDPSDITKGDPP